MGCDGPVRIGQKTRRHDVRQCSGWRWMASAERLASRHAVSDEDWGAERLAAEVGAGRHGEIMPRLRLFSAQKPRLLMRESHAVLWLPAVKACRVSNMCVPRDIQDKMYDMAFALHFNLLRGIR